MDPEKPLLPVASSLESDIRTKSDVMKQPFARTPLPLSRGPLSLWVCATGHPPRLKIRPSIEGTSSVYILGRSGTFAGAVHANRLGPFIAPGPTNESNLEIRGSRW